MSGFYEEERRFLREARAMAGYGGPALVHRVDRAKDLEHVRAILASLPPSQAGTEHNATCPRCGAPAYHGLLEIECSRSCAPETTARPREQKPKPKATRGGERQLEAASPPMAWVAADETNTKVGSTVRYPAVSYSNTFTVTDVLQLGGYWWAEYDDGPNTTIRALLSRLEVLLLVP